MEKYRGSIWANSQKKAGFSKSIGSYGYHKAGDRFFKLTTMTSGKSRVYESPEAAIRDGWYIVVHGK